MFYLGEFGCIISCIIENYFGNQNSIWEQKIIGISRLQKGYTDQNLDPAQRRRQDFGSAGGGILGGRPHGGPEAKPHGRRIIFEIFQKI